MKKLFAYCLLQVNFAHIYKRPKHTLITKVGKINRYNLLENLIYKATGNSRGNLSNCHLYIFTNYYIIHEFHELPTNYVSCAALKLVKDLCRPWYGVDMRWSSKLRRFVEGEWLKVCLCTFFYGINFEIIYSALDECHPPTILYIKLIPATF